MSTWATMTIVGKTKSTTADSRYLDIERSWLSSKIGTPPPGRGSTPPDMLKPEVALTTRAMSVIYLCPWCSRVEQIRFDQLGDSVETACRRGRVTVVQKISEGDNDAR